MNYLLITLGVVVVLVVLYLVARRVKPFGQSLAFVCAVAGRLLVTLAYHMGHAAAFCNRACLATLRSITDTGEWNVLDILKRVEHFIVGLLILLGETIQVMEILPILFPTATHIALPPFAEYSSAALFICCSALFGEILLECWGKIRGVGLFHNMGKPSRWILGVVTALLLVFSILVNGYFYLYRAAILDHDNTQGMTLFVLGGLGLEVSAVSPFALLTLTQGSIIVIAFLMWLAEITCEIVRAAATFFPDLLDTLAFHLSGGTIGVYGTQIERPPYQYPPLPASSSQTALSSQTAMLSLPEHASIVDAEREEVQPVETIELEETTHMNIDKNAFLSFIGEFGGQMFPHVVQAIDRLNAKDSILNSYFLERALTNVNTSIPGIHDLSHNTAEKNLSMLNAATEDEADHTLLCDLYHKIAEDDRHLLAIPASFVHFIDCQKLITAVQMLEANKKRLPLISQVVVTSVSQQDMQHKGVLTGLADCVSLWQDRMIDGIALVAPDALFPLQHGVVTRNRAIAQFFVSLIIAHRHHPTNPHFSSVLKQCSHLSPFIGVSIASLRVALGAMPKRFAWIPGVKGQAGTSILANILTESREAIDRVLTEEDTRTFQSQVRTNEACGVLVNIPVALNDVKFNPIARALSQYTGTTYPFVQNIATVRANGIPLPSHLNGRFLVSAFALYPLQPQSLQALQSVRNSKRVAFDAAKVTPLYPLTAALEPLSSNGHAPIEDKKAATTKKVTSATRQKKTTASTRRVVRKNTKQEAK